MLRKQLDALVEEFSLYSLDVGDVNKGESLTRTICLFLGVAMFFLCRCSMETACGNRLELFRSRKGRKGITS